MKIVYSIFFVLLTFISCGKKEINKDELPVETKDATIVENVVEDFVEEKYTLPSIVFTVQIAALETLNKDLESLLDVAVYKENKLTKYRLGNFATYQDAIAFKKMVVKSYPDAFIQALENDKPIHISKALQ